MVTVPTTRGVSWWQARTLCSEEQEPNEAFAVRIFHPHANAYAVPEKHIPSPRHATVSP